MIESTKIDRDNKLFGCPKLAVFSVNKIKMKYEYLLVHTYSKKLLIEILLSRLLIRNFWIIDSQILLINLVNELVEFYHELVKETLIEVGCFSKNFHK